MRRALFLSLACALAFPLAGCGPESGVSEGATVTAYVSGKPLCKGARQELSSSNGRAGSFRVRMVCLSEAESSSSTLAAAGTNARRATEDSTTVGYITEIDPTSRFSRSILDAAGIAQLVSSSGSAAMSRMLRTIRQAGTSDGLRESVYDELG